MTQQINVIDLDKTLIPYDSFRLLIKEKIFDLDFFVIRLTILRVFKLKSSKKYKKQIIRHFSLKYDEVYFISFAEKILNDIDNEVLELVKKETKKDTVNILLSASPNFFVRHIILKLGWMGKGSYFDKEEKFIHLYDENKINWLLTHYKPSDFIYNFAISDSSSDENLLSLFKTNIKWTLQ